jgi:hypothetical protein
VLPTPTAVIRIINLCEDGETQMNWIYLTLGIAALIAAIALLAGVSLATLANVAGVGAFVIALVELIRRSIAGKN